MKIQIKLVLCLMIVSAVSYSQEDKRLLPYKAEISLNEVLGHLLSQQDWAAEVGTDAIIRLGADLTNKNLKEFIVEKMENNWMFSFVGKRRLSYGIYYQIEVSNKGPIDESYKAYSKPIKLSKQQKRMFKATQLAKKQDFKRCSDNYNNATINLGNLDGTQTFFVYLLAATNDKTINIGGGHHRYLIDSKKNTVKKHYQHTNSCLNSITNEEATSLVFTHFTSETPNEFHIYMSYLYKMPIFVLTLDNEIIWRVLDGKIEAVEFPNDNNKDISLQERMRNYIKEQKSN